MELLADKLAAARDGDIPDATDLRQPFRDWCRVMIAYEQHRFHDADRDACHAIAQSIQRNHWRKWVVSQL
jgi:hypothetical protein